MVHGCSMKDVGMCDVRNVMTLSCLFQFAILIYASKAIMYVKWFVSFNNKWKKKKYFEFWIK